LKHAKITKYPKNNQYSRILLQKNQNFTFSIALDTPTIGITGHLHTLPFKGILLWQRELQGVSFWLKPQDLPLLVLFAPDVILALPRMLEFQILFLLWQMTWDMETSEVTAALTFAPPLSIAWQPKASDLQPSIPTPPNALQPGPPC
jgi:hypothetical protein